MLALRDQIVDAVGQLLDYIGDEQMKADFTPASIIVQPQRGIARDNDNGLVVAAFDRVGKPFDYAWYISPEGRIEADGY